MDQEQKLKEQQIELKIRMNAEAKEILDTFLLEMKEKTMQERLAIHEGLTKRASRLKTIKDLICE